MNQTPRTEWDTQKVMAGNITSIKKTTDMQNTTNKEKERRDHPPAISNYRKEEVKNRRGKKEGALQETNNHDKLINQSTFGVDYTSPLYLLRIIQVFIEYQIYFFQEKKVFYIPLISAHISSLIATSVA